VLVIVAPPTLGKVAPDFRATSPYVLAGALFGLVALIAALTGLIAGGVLNEHQIGEMVDGAKKAVAEFSREANDLKERLAGLPAALSAIRENEANAVRTLERTCSELSASLKMHLQIVTEQFGQSLITYKGMAAIEASVSSGDDILILTSALELEEGELANIIRGNLSRGVKYTYLLPSEDLTIRERMQRLAAQWQHDCSLSRSDAEQRIKCILVPKHFAYMTVAVYSAYAKTPTVLVKFPVSPVFSENKYPLIYRVADKPEQAAKVFVDALQELIDESCGCTERQALSLRFS